MSWVSRGEGKIIGNNGNCMALSFKSGQEDTSMIQVLIQVAAGSCKRNLYDESTLEYLETRQASRPYPYPYGFVIGTNAVDGDCVDCYLPSSCLFDTFYSVHSLT